MDTTNSLITAISTLFGIGLTLFFTNKREKSRFLRDFQVKEYLGLEAFYTDLISSLDLTIQLTHYGDSYKDTARERSILTAKTNLIAPGEINKKLSEVNDLMYDWASKYKKSLPVRIGETNHAIYSTENIPFKEAADKMYSELRSKIGQLVTLIKMELRQQKEQLERRRSK